MGKSRTIDQLAQTKFTIPINLRHPKETGTCSHSPYKLLNLISSGYPPSDTEVHSYFTSSHISTKQASYRCAEAFVEALCTLTAEILENKHVTTMAAWLDPMDIEFKAPMEFANLAHQFRKFMASGMDQRRHGEFRTWFYHEGVTMARKLVGFVFTVSNRRSEKVF